MLGQRVLLHNGIEGTIISESMGDIIVIAADGTMVLRKTDRTEHMIHDFKVASRFFATGVDEEELVAALNIPKPEPTPEQKQKEKEKIISTKKLIRKSNKKASDN